GAKVVAVEPNPSVCAMLRRLARTRAIYVENCAVGDTPGRLTLHACVEHPSLSTVTHEWLETAEQSARHGHPHWQPIEVDVVTLDQLASRHGIPAFVKIDVEGFDDHVIRGMSFRPRCLSFEFNMEVQHVALDCLEMLKSDYEFNYSCTMDGLASSHWMNAPQLRSRIFDGTNYYGDVLARRLQ
ncbi:MAG TPA: FkbM family methyltransferase, partial [Acidobacteriota bacterium]|nr:FkbM family methyltransferase [Acidobacteriota bacterium]